MDRDRFLKRQNMASLSGADQCQLTAIAPLYMCWRRLPDRITRPSAARPASVFNADTGRFWEADVLSRAGH